MVTGMTVQRLMTLRERSMRPLVLAVVLAVGGCARSRPLPGDSVSEDGSVSLSPPKYTSGPLDPKDNSSGEPTRALGPVESRLYPPELIMDHQGELGITAEQRQTLITETERGATELARLSWDLQAEKEKLVKLLEGDHVDEAKVQEAASRVMDRESKIKASQLGMLVRIKNTLTSEQIAKLRELRAEGADKKVRVNASDAQSGGPVTSPAPRPAPKPSTTSTTSAPHASASTPTFPTSREAF